MRSTNYVLILMCTKCNFQRKNQCIRLKTSLREAVCPFRCLVLVQQREPGIAMQHQQALWHWERHGWVPQSLYQGETNCEPNLHFYRGAWRKLLAYTDGYRRGRGFPIFSNNNTISEAVQIARLPTNAHLSSYTSRMQSLLRWSVGCALLKETEK